MTRATVTFTISLPPEMAEEIEEIRQKEHRTRSELLREALRRYIFSATYPRSNEERSSP
jgi:metal-responsive CopG/Arc/MetJ family transcriptional regulator